MAWPRALGHDAYSKMIDVMFIYRPPLAEMGRVKRKGHENLEYVGRQFLSELGLGQWRGWEYWDMMLILQ